MNDPIDTYEHLDDPAIPDNPETPDQRAKRIGRRVANPVPRDKNRSPNFNPSWIPRSYHEERRVVKQPETPAWMVKPLRPPGR